MKSIRPETSGIHHVSLRTADLQRSKRFYTETMGFKVVVEMPDLCLIQVGSGLVGLRAPTADTPANDTFNPFRVGMDHFALACPNRQELERVARALEEASIWNTGVKFVEPFNAHYVGFKDPDGIKLELWLG